MLQHKHSPLLPHDNIRNRITNKTTNVLVNTPLRDLVQTDYWYVLDGEVFTLLEDEEFVDDFFIDLDHFFIRFTLPISFQSDNLRDKTTWYAKCYTQEDFVVYDQTNRADFANFQ